MAHSRQRAPGHNLGLGHENLSRPLGSASLPDRRRPLVLIRWPSAIPGWTKPYTGRSPSNPSTHSLCLASFSLSRAAPGKPTPSVGEQTQRGVESIEEKAAPPRAPRRCACPPVGGCATVKRLHGGADRRARTPMRVSCDGLVRFKRKMGSVSTHMAAHIHTGSGHYVAAKDLPPLHGSRCPRRGSIRYDGGVGYSCTVMTTRGRRRCTTKSMARACEDSGSASTHVLVLEPFPDSLPTVNPVDSGGKSQKH
jgi:hypothetical protein